MIPLENLEVLFKIFSKYFWRLSQKFIKELFQKIFLGFPLKNVPWISFESSSAFFQWIAQEFPSEVSFEDRPEIFKIIP